MVAAIFVHACGSPANVTPAEPADVPTTSACALPNCSDRATSADLGTSSPDPAVLIRFDDADGAAERRAKLRAYVWGEETLPEARPMLTEIVEWPSGMESVDRSAVARLDRLDAAITGTNMRARSYVLRPMIPAEDGPRVVIIHQGHTGPFEEGGLGRAASFLLRRGFIVVAMHMPVFGWNSANPNGWSTHEDMFANVAPENLGSIFRMFIEPIVQNVSYFHDARDIAMIGLSGGGWATTIAAAIDPRIRVAMEVAGSAPLYARETLGDIGDREQWESTLYGEDIAPDGTGGGVATWLEIYVLAGQGEGRRAIQVNNELDPCCFAGGIADSYATLVSERVHALGAGEWSNVIDVGATTHEISEHILESILAPALVPPIVTSDARRPPTVGP